MAQHNWMQGMQKDERVVTLYDVDSKSVIGIFANTCIASKFIFGLDQSGYKKTVVSNACKNKSRLRKSTTKLEFEATVRCANPSQIEQLGNMKYIFPGDVAPSHEFVQNISCKYRD